MMQKLKQHYHWVIAAVILVELAIHVGILNNSSSLYIIPVTTDLSISRGSFSLAYSIRSLSSFFSVLFSGVFFSRFGYRKLATVALFTSSAAYVLLSSSQNTWMLGIGFALMGLAEGFCAIAAATRLIGTWFHAHKGLVLGLVTASSGIGGSLTSMLLTHTIESTGWRSSYLLCAVLVASAAVLILLFSRDHPRQMGLLPLGSDRHLDTKEKKKNRDHWYGYETKDIFRKPTFYLLLPVIFLCCVCNHVAFAVIVPHFRDCGLSATEAASLQSIMLLALSGAKLLCGIINDALGAKVMNVLCLFCAISALLLLAFTGSYVIGLIAMLLFSMSLVMTGITAPLLTNAIFGYHPQSTMISIVMAIPPASSTITTPIVNAIYDRIGSYRPIFLVAAGIGVATLLMMLLLFILADRDRKRYEQDHPELSEMEETV